MAQELFGLLQHLVTDVVGDILCELTARESKKRMKSIIHGNLRRRHRIEYGLSSRSQLDLTLEEL